MRLVQRAQTSATPAQVWEVLGDASRWPEFEPFLRRVRGAHRAASAGQVLVGVSRVALLTIPIDVLEAVAPHRLVLRVHTAPGVGEVLAFDVLPRVHGGSDVQLAVEVDGVLGRLAVPSLWLAAGMRVRLLAVRAERIARAARRAA